MPRARQTHSGVCCCEYRPRNTLDSAGLPLRHSGALLNVGPNGPTVLGVGCGNPVRRPLPEVAVDGVPVPVQVNSITATSRASASADLGAGTSWATIAGVHRSAVALSMISARRTARSMSFAQAVMGISTTSRRLSSVLMVESWGRGGGLAHPRRSTEERIFSCRVSLAQDHYPYVVFLGKLCGRVQGTCADYCGLDGFRCRFR